MVSDNSILPQSVEEMFYFTEVKMPYLYGLWRFANAYIIKIYRGET